MKTFSKRDVTAKSNVSKKRIDFSEINARALPALSSLLSNNNLYSAVNRSRLLYSG